MTRYSLRQLLLMLLLAGIIGLGVELLLLEHTESFSQWIPHVALGAGLLTVLVVMVRPSRPALRSLQIVMASFLAVGLLGLYFHYKGNVEFAVERDPALTGAGLVWKALRGATPTLAPGAMVQLGLLGLLYAHRHPVLGYGNSATFDT